MIFYGKFIDLSFKPDNQKQWLDFAEKYNKKKVVLEITEDKPKRTLDQNAYLWGIVYKTISDYNGDTENDLHEYLKRKLLPPKFIKVLGKEVKVPASTTDLSKSDFSDYIERIRAEVSHLGIIIPEAQEDEFKVESVYPINNLGESKF